MPPSSPTPIVTRKMFQYNLNWSYAADIGMAMFAILAVILAVYFRVAQPTKE